MSNAQVASARDVALEIERRLPGVGETKLHKLLYYVQGYHLAWEQGPAYAEDIQAWELGPVVSQVWHDRKHPWLKKFRRSVDSPKPLPDSVHDITANVVSRFGEMSGQDLVEATHREDPWRLATDEGRNVANQVISHQSLAEYFSTEPDWVRQMREHVATIRDDKEFAPDPPGALDAVIAKHFPG